jgi:hypothetical protein
MRRRVAGIRRRVTERRLSRQESLAPLGRLLGDHHIRSGERAGFESVSLLKTAEPSQQILPMT